MYINPFLAGIFFTILVELVIIFISLFVSSRKGK